MHHVRYFSVSLQRKRNSNEPFKLIKLKSYDYISLRQDQSWFKYS